MKSYVILLLPNLSQVPEWTDFYTGGTIVVMLSLSKHKRVIKINLNQTSRTLISSGPGSPPMKKDSDRSIPFAKAKKKNSCTDSPST